MSETLDQFHWHEALDRASLIADIFERDLLEHPAVKETPRLRRKASKLATLLWGLYQEIGSEGAAQTTPTNEKD